MIPVTADFLGLDEISLILFEEFCDCMNIQIKIKLFIAICLQIKAQIL